MPGSQWFKSIAGASGTQSVTGGSLGYIESSLTGDKIKIFDLDPGRKDDHLCITSRTSRAVFAAKQSEGIREATGKNDGAFVQEFRYGRKGDIPWCGAFVNWCYNPMQDPGMNILGLSDRDVLSSQAYMRRAKEKGCWADKNSGYKPKVGDLVVWTNEKDSSHGHVAMVTEIKPNGQIVVTHGNFEDAVVTKSYSSVRDMEVAGDDPNSTNKLSGFVRLNDYYNGGDNYVTTKVYSS